MGLGGAALAGLLGEGRAEAGDGAAAREGAGAMGLPDFPNFPPRAKRVIYLFMSGGPAQQDLFDYKPKLREMNGQPLPAEVRGTQRLTGMSSNQSVLPLAGSQFEFKQHGQSGAWMSELLPKLAERADDICFIKTLWTEAINHDPAMTFFQTGSQIAGRPSLGAWAGYGLGSVNQNLPAFVVLVTKKSTDQPLAARLWGTGFLDSRYQGVRFSSGKDAVFYLTNPEGVSTAGRRLQLDGMAALNKLQ